MLGGGDCGGYVAQQNSAGSALNFASVIGGPDSITDLAERLGYVYLTGVISSDDLPTTPGVIQPVRRVADDFQTVQRDPTDAFVAKLSPGGAAIEFETYLGGTGTDSGMGIAIDRDQNGYIALRTSSQYLPTTPGAFQPLPGGNVQDFDAFVAKLNPTATRRGEHPIHVNPVAWATRRGWPDSTVTGLRNPVHRQCGGSMASSGGREADVCAAQG